MAEKANDRGIISFLTRCGEAGLRVQPVLKSIENITLTKRGESRVTFFTDPDLLSPTDVMKDARFIPMMIFIPRDDFMRAKDGTETGKLPDPKDLDAAQRQG